MNELSLSSCSAYVLQLGNGEDAEMSADELVIVQMSGCLLIAQWVLLLADSPCFCWSARQRDTAHESVGIMVDVCLLL